MNSIACESDSIEDTKTSHSCLHCNAPLDRDTERLSGFCCHGCESVYQILQDQGLCEYYGLKERWNVSSSAPVDSSLVQETFVDLDHPNFWKKHVRSLPGGLVQTNLRMQGIHCAACVWLLEKLPRTCPGLVSAYVQMSNSTIELTWSPQKIQLSQIAKRAAEWGYRFLPIGNANREEELKKEQRTELIRIGIAAACSGNVMLLALAIYAGEWTGMSSDHLQLMRYFSTAIGLVSLLGPGSVFFRGAIAAVRTRTAHMDLPVAVGLGVGAVSGIWNTFAGDGELYFDSLTMLVLLLLAGRFLQSRQQRAAGDAVHLLSQITPRTTFRIVNEEPIPIAVDDVKVDDVLEVRSDSTIPVDGEIVRGNSQIDMSLLTGESEYHNVSPGDQVVAGTVNQGSSIRIKAMAVGDSTRIGKLVQKIDQHGLRKAPIVQWADKVSGWFVCTVLTVATVVAISWYLVDPSKTSDRVVAVLIVACPCALGLATPMAVAMGLGLLARRGALVKGGDTLQRVAAKNGVIVLDKTGTITSGKPKVIQWMGEEHLIPLLYQLELEKTHPIAVAIREFCRESPPPHQTAANRFPARQLGTPQMEVEDSQAFAGQGLSGIVHGHRYIVGNKALIHRFNATIPTRFQQFSEAILKSNLSPVYVAQDHEVVAIMGVGDAVRDEALSTIRDLQSAGWTMMIASGDENSIVQNVAQEVGIPTELAFGNASPESKLTLIEDLKKKYKTTIMVGDGINDAGALAAADVGISIRGGAEVSMQVADAFLANGSLKGIEEILATGEKTMRIIKRNAAASLTYNVIAVSAAAVGILHPLAAAILMPISSLTVVAVTTSGYLMPQKQTRRSSQP